MGYLDCAILICILTFCCIRTAATFLTPVIIPSGFIPCFCYIFPFSHMYQLLFVATDKTVCFRGEVKMESGLVIVLHFLQKKRVVPQVISWLLGHPLFSTSCISSIYRLPLCPTSVFHLWHILVLKSSKLRCTMPFSTQHLPLTLVPVSKASPDLSP